MKKFLCTLLAMLMICQTFVGTTSAVTAAEENASETPATPTVPTTCAAGCENPDWQPISAIGNINDLESGHYHIYLDADVTPRQIVVPATVSTICLDLNGHSITTDGRSAIISTGTVFNLMDSSEAQTGYICGTQGDNNQAGGTISIQDGAVFNLYSGTLRFVWDTEGKQVLQSSGVVWVQAGGTMNMYGGTVEGADLSDNAQFLHSAAIFVASEVTEDEEGNVTEEKIGRLNVSGGNITAGLLPETGIARCVRLASGAQLTLSGDARIDDIWAPVGTLTVDGTFSGDVNLHLSNKTPAQDLVIGSATNSPAITGSIYCYAGDGWDVLVDGENLILHAAAPFTKDAYCDHCKTEVTWKSITKSNYPQMQTVGNNHFYLTENLSLRQLLLEAGVHTCLDLNGFGITTDGRSAIVYGGASLNIMDSSEGKTGYICGTRGSNNQKGGTLMVYDQAELNLYGGSLRFEMDDTGSVLLQSAGVVWINAGGTMNMYGGTVEGADLSTNEAFTYGATVYISASVTTDEGGTVIEEKIGRLNAYSGKITSGVLPEDGKADCIFAEEDAKVLLTGDAHIEEIYAKQNTLMLDGTFTGEAWLNLYGATATEGMVVGEAANTPIIDGTLFCINDDGWHIRVSDNQEELILEAYDPILEERYCQHCKKTVTFKAITKGNYVQAKNPGEHHFFLYDEDFTAGQILVQNTASTCIDLNGYNIHVSGRAFNVAADSTLNLMDSSDPQTGKVIATTGINNCGGGLAFIHQNGTFNMYGGTLELVTQYVPGKGVGTGGLIYLSGATMNMYGGTLNGADMTMSEYPHLTWNGCGATIFISGSSQLNVYDGQINSGTLAEGCIGECVYLRGSTARITLAGDAVVEDIYIDTEKDQLIVSGEYTGSANLSYPDSVELTYLRVVGTSDDATLTPGTITCDEYSIKVLGDQLVLDYEATAVIFNSTGILFADTLADAISHSTDGYIMLLRSVEETISTNKDVYLDLNGNTVAGSITLAENKSLYCMDRQTDDFTIKDINGYGKLTASVTNDAVAGIPAEAPFTELPKLSGIDGFQGYAYLPIEEDSGTSFHAVNLTLTAMTLRPETVGLYYKCAFAADEMVAPLVESYGVALSVRAVPNATNLDEACEFTTFTGFTPGGMDQDATSSLLTNIMKIDNAGLVNARNARTPVYGRAYIKTSNGYLFGQHRYRSLQTQVELIDARWDTLTVEQQNAILEMSNTYSRFMQTWNIPNIRSAQPKTEA